MIVNVLKTTHDNKEDIIQIVKQTCTAFLPLLGFFMPAKRRSSTTNDSITVIIGNQLPYPNGIKSKYEK